MRRIRLVPTANDRACLAYCAFGGSILQQSIDCAFGGSILQQSIDCAFGGSILQQSIDCAFGATGVRNCGEADFDIGNRKMFRSLLN